MSAILTSDPSTAPSARTTSPSSSSRRSPVVSSVSSAATAALGAAAATLRLLGLLSDVSLRTAEKGKAVAADSGYESDSSSSSSNESIDLIQGMRRSRRRDYSPETDLALSGLAAYDLPVSAMGAYCVADAVVVAALSLVIVSFVLQYHR